MDKEQISNELIKALRCDHPSLDCEFCEYNTGDDCNYKRLTDDAADAIEKMQKQLPRWISVKDRLPENGENVLLYFESDARYGDERNRKRIIGIGFHCNEHWHVDLNSVETAIAWMPLPDPPKEEMRCNPCQPTQPECGECEFAKVET